MKKSVDVQKTFPDIQDVSQIFGGSSVCRCDMKAGFNSPSNGGCQGNNPSGLVTCGISTANRLGILKILGIIHGNLLHSVVLEVFQIIP